ncbi:protein of unknown function [Ruminococcaceae bacterium BL-6]|jgi:hypothetical protein|nr:protein of unknown function [Ruminococcaceae bacterium BL-6]
MYCSTISEAKKNFPHIIEQKMAYNVLFSDADINGLSLEKILYMFDKYYATKFQTTHKRINIDIIKQCIIKNYEQYKNHPFIAGNYAEIGERLPV